MNCGCIHLKITYQDVVEITIFETTHYFRVRFHDFVVGAATNLADIHFQIN